jgi:Secretion system C-terminal sorting domain/PKD domain
MIPIRPLLNSSLLFVSLIAFSLSGFSQQFLTTISGWNAYVHLPDDYNAKSPKKYPTIVFFPGTGEVGSDPNLLLKYGPGHFMAQGYDLNSFVVNGRTIKPIIISLQPPGLYPQPWQLNIVFDAIIARWNVDPSHLNLTGLSMGGFCGDNFVTESVANANRINSMVNMSAVIPNYPITNFSFYALSGGKVWWFEGLYDNRGMDQMTAIMNATVPASARYTSYVGGHCCWNTWYDPGYTENVNGQNWNIYQWMLAQTKAGIPSPPAVSAGADQAISKKRANLTGAASGNNGANIVSTSWTQVSGPNTANIQSPDQLSTKISGLQPGVYVFMLSATDNKGLSNTSSVTVTVGTPQQPTVNAGPAQIIALPTNVVTLNGAASGNRGAAIVSTVWTQTSGPNSATINSASNLTTNVSGLVAGVYVFQLSATDDNGLSSSATVSVTVNAVVNMPPTVDPGSDQSITLPTNSVTLSAIASGSNGASITSTSWTQTSGPNTASIGAAASLSTGVTGLIAGTYTFKFTATDNHGLFNIGNVTITVNPSTSTAPNVNAGSNQSINLPANTVSLTGTASGNNGATISSTTWTQNSGPNSANIKTASSLSTAVSGLIAGAYVFKLTAKDNTGLSSSSTVTVTIASSSSQPPTVNAGNTQVMTLPFNTTTLAGSASGNNGATISSTTWTQNNGPNSASIASASSLSTLVTGLIAGNYVFKMTATDNNGMSSSSTMTVTVNAPIPPTVYAGPAQSITSPAGSVTLSGAATGNYGASINTTTWTQNSGPNTAKIGTPSNLSTPVTGLITGTYIFKLTASDNDGLSSSATITITVNPAARVAPNVSAGSDQAITLPVNSISLSGKASGNNGATIASTVWSQTSGPNTSQISASSSLVTNITGLVQGVYMFQLLATDNNGSSNTSTVTITVDRANLPPNVNAGSAQTITLPVNTLTLNGTASGDNDATISSIIWNEVSGPNSASLASASSLSTGVNGLIQGVYVFKLTAKDNKGLSNSATVTVRVNAAANIPPTVNAGVDQTIALPVSSINLSGSASGNNGASISSTGWNQTSGPNTANIISSSSLSSTLTGLIAGKYSFELTVTDNNGLSSVATVMITVQAANTPPMVNAGPAQSVSYPASSVTLSGTSTALNGATISSMVWTETSGPNSANIATPTNSSTDVKGLKEGVYVFKLTATDNTGLSNTATVTVTVNAAPNVAPVVNAGSDQTITLPVNTVVLTGAASGSNGATISSTEWTQTSGPNAGTIAASSNLSSNVTGLIQGVYTFQLSATDNNGLSNTSSLTVTISADPQASPTVNAGAAQAITLPANSVTLTGTVSANNGASIKNTQWIEASGPNTALINSSFDLTTTVSGMVQGTYTFVLTATEDNGLSQSSITDITVNPVSNQAPVANAGTDQTITLPENWVVLDGTGSYDPDGSIVSYSWTKISGLGGVTIVNSNTASPTATNLLAGQYVFELTVTDDAGATGKDQVTITVNSAIALPPVANAGNDTIIALPVDTTVLNGTASKDPDDSIVAYQWQEVSGPTNATLISAGSAISRVGNLVAGDYVFELTVTNSQGLSSRASVKVSLVSIFRYTSQLLLFPNPAHDIVNLHLISDTLGTVMVKIYDMNGRLVQAEQMEKQQGYFEKAFSVSHLSNGVYVLEAIIGLNDMMTVQFIKK